MSKNIKIYNRKHFLINPRFQLNYIKHTIFLMLMTVVIFYGASLYHFWNFKKQGQAAGLPEEHIFFKFLQQQQSSMEIVFLVTAFVVAIFIVAYGIFLSHKVAGPLYRMNRYLEENRGSNTSEELKFRKDDYFPELADNFNKYIEELKNSVPR